MVIDIKISSFSVKSQLCSQTLIIFVRGYLNRAGGEDIIRVAGSPEYIPIRKIILALEGVQAANSVGIAHLLEMQERLKARRGRLALVGASPELARTFNIMGLYTHAFKAESVREALALLF